MEATTIDSQLQSQIQTLWVAEKMLTEAMPIMVEQATHLGLKKNLALHLAETRQHKEALHLMAKQMGFELDAASGNTDLQSILEQGQEALAAHTSSEAKDAAIIAGAKQIEIYEMTKYKEAGALAKSLGLEAVAKRLQLTFEEERQSSTKLRFLEKELVYKTSLIGVPE